MRLMATVLGLTFVISTQSHADVMAGKCQSSVDGVPEARMLFHVDRKDHANIEYVYQNDEGAYVKSDVVEAQVLDRKILGFITAGAKTVTQDSMTPDTCAKAPIRKMIFTQSLSANALGGGIIPGIMTCEIADLKGCQ